MKKKFVCKYKIEDEKKKNAKLKYFPDGVFMFNVTQ